MKPGHVHVWTHARHNRGPPGWHEVVALRHSRTLLPGEQPPLPGLSFVSTFIRDTAGAGLAKHVGHADPHLRGRAPTLLQTRHRRCERHARCCSASGGERAIDRSCHRANQQPTRAFVTRLWDTVFNSCSNSHRAWPRRVATHAPLAARRRYLNAFLALRSTPLPSSYASVHGVNNQLHEWRASCAS